ncbi:ANK_REP_REGION domain-containing protein [Trichoderma simmonsii]|uniref:ANK_REP_REGION domain-containing protein n=1 Tax=Trichoderma simmonsii TaxID=1491479 RepID=A0A8G0L8X6_9HYPO|nr:ANK_REP_REGION domain-containing protein [Trichoderma simmonsii]
MSQSQYTHEDYTIGWVCALPNEQAAALFMLDERHEDLVNPSNDQNAYTLGSIGKHKVVIAGLPKGRYGNNSSATVATRMISTFPNIRVGLMVGIGGGIPEKTRLGDVVISCPSGTEPGVVQWDMGKAEHGGQFKRTGSLAPPPTALLTALGKFEADQITSRAKMLSYLDGLKSMPTVPRSFLKSDSLTDVLFDPTYAHVEGEDCSRCDEKMLVQRKTREDDMMIHCGLIASGNQVIKDAVLRDKLYQMFDKNVLCVEMEAAGLMNDFPCIVIRGICDYADSHKDDKWQDHAAAVAAACAKAFLAVVPASEVDKLQRVQVSITPSVLQGARSLVAGWWGDKQNTPSIPAASSPTSEPEDTKKDEIQKTPALGTVPSTDSSVSPTDTNVDSISTEPSSGSKSREASPDRSISTQTRIESLLQEAPALLTKMVQGGQVDRALDALIESLNSLRTSQRDISTPQNVVPQNVVPPNVVPPKAVSQGPDWNIYPQTPPMSPQNATWTVSANNGYVQDIHRPGSRNSTYIAAQPRSQSWTPSGDNGYVQDPHGYGSRRGSYVTAQPWPAYNYGNVSSSVYHPQAEFGNPGFIRSQTYPSDPRFNQPSTYQTTPYPNYGRNAYDANYGVLQPNYYQKAPSWPPNPQINSVRDGYYEGTRQQEYNARMNVPGYASDVSANSYQFTEPQRQTRYSELPTNNDITQRRDSVSLNPGLGYSSTNHSSIDPNRQKEILSGGLFSQIKKGDAAAVKRLLEQGADIEKTNGDGLTPLWCAVQLGKCDVIQVLLDKKADTESLNTRGQNILEWAVENREQKIIDMLFP